MCVSQEGMKATVWYRMLLYRLIYRMSQGSPSTVHSPEVLVKLEAGVFHGLAWRWRQHRPLVFDGPATAAQDHSKLLQHLSKFSLLSDVDGNRIRRLLSIKLLLQWFPFLLIFLLRATAISDRIRCRSRYMNTRFVIFLCGVQGCSFFLIGFCCTLARRLFNLFACYSSSGREGIEASIRILAV